MTDSPPIKVTNNTSGVIELFDVYQQTTGSEPPTETTPVTYTSLGTVRAGETSIVKILHSSNHIVAMQNGPLADPTGGTQVNFPVKVIAVLSISKNRSFVVEQADKSAMEQTFRFVRYVSANPGSGLTTQFLAALNTKEQTNAVNMFFKQSRDFTSCTMATWSAVTAWQTDFLSAWQGSYYLYDASEDLKVMKLVAGVSVTLSGTDVKAQLNMADADGAWTTDSQRTDLTIAGGMVSENAATLGMAVSLRPVWMNAVQTGTGNDRSATSVVAPAMAGTVNGTKVLGNFKKMPTPKDGSPSSSGSLLALLKQNIGVLISAGMLFIMYKQWQESKNTKADEVVKKGQADRATDDTIRQDVDDSNTRVEAAAQADRAPDLKSNAKAFESFPRNEADARVAQAKVDVQETVSRQQDALESVLEEAPASPATDELVNSLQRAIDRAGAGDLEGAMADLGEAGTHLQTLMDKNERAFSQEAREAAEAVQEDIKAETERAEAERRAEQEQRENSDKGSEDPIEDEDLRNAEAPEMGFPEGVE